MKSKFYSLWLCVICAIVFVLQMLFNGFTDALVLDSSQSFEIWRFVSAIFLHANGAHLISNLFALALFGMILEGFIGSRRFLIVFFSSGIIANIVAVSFYPSSLGASGAIYGILGALVIVRPMLVVWAYGLPMPMFIAGVVWVAGGLVGLFVPSNTGHIAHLSGIAVGLLFGIFFRDWKRKHFIQQENRIVFNEQAVRRWEDENLG